jgi:hypothetical protein
MKRSNKALLRWRPGSCICRSKPTLGLVYSRLKNDFSELYGYIVLREPSVAQARRRPRVSIRQSQSITLCKRVHGEKPLGSTAGDVPTVSTSKILLTPTTMEILRASNLVQNIIR